MPFQTPNIVFSLDRDRTNQTTWLEKVEVWSVAIMIFILSVPYPVWNNFILFFIAEIFCIALLLKHIKLRNQQDLMIAFLLTVCYCYFSFMYDNGIVAVLAKYFGYVIFFFVDYEFLAKVLKKYIIVFAVTIFPSIVQYVLIIFGNVDFPYNVIDGSMWNPKSYMYNQYAFLVVSHRGLETVLPRFHGYYDEPGVVGTITAVLLWVQHFNLRKWYNIIIFIAGILSFSLFFFVCIFLFVFCFAKRSVKITTILVSLVIVITLYNNEILNKYIFSRFEFENGNWNGWNRESVTFDFWYKDFQERGGFYWGARGVEREAFNSYYGLVATSYKRIFVEFGMIPFAVYITLLLLRAFSRFKFNREMFVYLFIPFLVYGQRPFIHMHIYTILTVVPLSYLYVEMLERKQVSQNV